MQTRLTIEEDDAVETSPPSANHLVSKPEEAQDLLSISQMPFHDITNSQPVGHIFPVTKLQEPLGPRISSLKNKIRPRVNFVPVPDCLSKTFDVVLGYSIGVGEDFGDSLGDGDLQSESVSNTEEHMRE